MYEMRSTSEADTVIVGLIVQKIPDLASEQSSRLSEANFEFTRRTFGHGNIPISLRKNNDKSFHDQSKFRGLRTIDSDLSQGES